MQFSHLPEALSFGIKKNFAWAQFQAAMLDLVQLRALIRDGLEKAICREWLHRQEEEKLETLHYEKRHIEWLGGRICAKQAARRYLMHASQDSHGQQSEPAAISASQLLIMNAASGRPFLDHKALPEDLSLPHLSISHSKRYALAVVTSTHCGIDIQAASDSLIRVKDRFCSMKEEEILAQGLKQLPGSDHLTLLWAAKEAVKKSVPFKHMPGFLDLTLTLIMTDTPACFLFTLVCHDSHKEHRQSLFHPRHQFLVTVGLHRGYGIGLCVTPSQPGACNA
ncbi:MAG: 4'-phosphopantetheinyl transferase superfamily protein [Desulfoarculaceae bacterium]|nr:4'-phosphopantetheinyl transferase superfamily protein [Desulfoarculaceae bacterium]